MDRIVLIGGGGGGGEVMQKKQSPDFRFPEVSISGLCTTTIVQTLSLFAVGHFCKIGPLFFFNRTLRIVNNL